MVKAFLKFINRGSVVDLAVAVIIGAAFSLIITSLVNDIIMPLIGIITGGIDFSGLAVKVGSATVAYGKFIQAIINFLLVAIVVFLIVEAYNKARDRFEKKKEEEPKKEEPTQEVILLTQIRDLLKNSPVTNPPNTPRPPQ